MITGRAAAESVIELSRGPSSAHTQAPDRESPSARTRPRMSEAITGKMSVPVLRTAERSAGKTEETDRPGPPPSVLSTIGSPADIKRLPARDLEQLAVELRQYIIEVVSKTGGHLAPSLGAVELTIALHYVFDAPRDRIVWDVGHQAYGHKVITGRRDRLPTIRQYKGLSGFPVRDESPYDTFNVAHAGTAISGALGMAVARDLKHQDFYVVAVVGDAGLTSGLELEGINNLGTLQKKVLVILNDNEMSISPNVGAIEGYLNRVVHGQ